MAQSARDETILMISDLHLTETIGPETAALNAVRRALRGRGALILLGDDTNNGRSSEHQRLRNWLWETQRLTGAEIFTVPGNHDFSRAVDPAAYRQLYSAFGRQRAFSRDRASASCAVMTRQGACLLLLDTNDADAGGSLLPNGGIRSEMLRWLEETLAALPAGTPVIACGHHPLLSRRQAAVNAEKLAALLARYQVPVYLCGHDHGFSAVRETSLQQITVGRPTAYPGWCGCLERGEEGFSFRTLPLYEADDPTARRLAREAEDLGLRMAAGTLKNTPYDGDAAAIRWFADVFLAQAGGRLTEASCAAFLADENCGKWREIETRTIVKKWLFQLLENCPQDVRSISLPWAE